MWVNTSASPWFTPQPDTPESGFFLRFTRGILHHVASQNLLSILVVFFLFLPSWCAFFWLLKGESERGRSL